MAYPAGHREKVRAEIVRRARDLFNLYGYAGVSIDDVMGAAGLTRGGFYSYFSTKEELYAEAITLILVEHPSENWEGIELDMEAADVARSIVNAYLSRQHYDDLPGTCPLVAHPTDVARGGDLMKSAYGTVFGAMVGLFEGQARSEVAEGREAALAVAALCVGGMVLARAASDDAFGDEIREACRRVALCVGGWPDQDAPVSGAVVTGSTHASAGPFAGGASLNSATSPSKSTTP